MGQMLLAGISIDYIYIYQLYQLVIRIDTLLYTNTFKVSPAWTWAVLRQVIISHIHNSLSWRTAGHPAEVNFPVISVCFHACPFCYGKPKLCDLLHLILKRTICLHQIQQTSMTLFIPYLCPKLIVLTKRNGFTFSQKQI